MQRPHHHKGPSEEQHATRNTRRRLKRASESPEEREIRLEKARNSSRRRRNQQKLELEQRLKLLSEGALRRVDFTEDEIRLMGSSQQFTTDPRLALAYYYSCGVDPRAFVYGDEQLNGDDGSAARNRLKQMFEDCPRPADIAACQKLADASESEAVDIWACASCGRLLLSSEGEDVVFRQLLELRPMFLLSDAERGQLLGGVSESVVKKYRQVFFDEDDIYFLIPELVRDTSRIPLCKKCCIDPRKSPFSVANGHDYGRVSSLPALNDTALNCITPVRCFGMDIALSSKHSSGHTICFPSDGPHKVSEVLPCVDRDCMPRVTFVGPREEWRIQQKKYKKLYSISADDVYEWLDVLSKINDFFQEEAIQVDDSALRRHQLHELDLAIETNVHVAESSDVMSIQELAISERYGGDIDDSAMEAKGGGEQQDLVVQQSAVMPAAQSDPFAGGIVDALLDALPGPPDDSVPAVPNTHEREKVIAIKRGCSPMVEWLENAKMIAGVFPNLFLTGSGPLPSGPLPRAMVDHFLHYWDGRFEKSTRFIAMLFNQLQRHTAVRNAARIGSTRSSTLQEFGKLASTPAFKEALEQAKADPESAKAVHLNVVLLRLLSLVGGSVPFSPFERSATRPKLGAMRHRYGVGQHWVTIAPPEQDDLLLHRIAHLRGAGGWNDPANTFVNRSCSFSDLPGQLQQSARARLSISNSYPALSAQVFERRLRSFTQSIMRCPDGSMTRLSRHYLERDCGVYVRVAGFNAVVEPQVDGRLHAHAIVYGGAVTPALLTRAAACSELWPEVRKWIETVSCTSISEEARNWCNAWQDAHGGKKPRAFDIRVPGAATDPAGFILAAERRTIATNLHMHAQTCHKGIRGKYVCRLSRPAGIHDSETLPLVVKVIVPSHLGKRRRAEFAVGTVQGDIADLVDRKHDYSNKRLLREHTNGAVVWEQYHPEVDSLFVETNLSLACLSRSHTNSAVINGLDGGHMIEEYQHAYMTKEKGGLKSSAAVMLTALQDMEKYPSVADDSGTFERQAKFLATRTVNAFTGATEWPHQLMAYALAGYRSYISSDSFWYVFPHQLVSYVEGDQQCNDENNGDDDSSADDSAGHEWENISDEGAFESECDSNSNIQSLLEKLVHASVNEGASGGTRANGRTGARMFTVDDKVVFVTQADSYRHRGKWFEEYSPMEFEMIVDILPRVEDSTDGETVRRGRPKRRGFDLAPEHPLSPQFQGFIRAKFRTPMLGGAPMPSLGKSGEPSASMSKYMLCLMLPWSLDNGKPHAELDSTGLLQICQQWNSIGAAYVNRERYRVIENILRKCYRSSSNEKACSEWRSRNADYWANQPQTTSHNLQANNLPSRVEPSDAEAVGVLPPEEFADLINAAAAKDVKKMALMTATRATFWSLIPTDRDYGEICPTAPSDPIYQPIDDSVNLAQIAKRIHSMPSQDERRRRTHSDVVTLPRGGSPVDSLALPDNFEERQSCSPDQREVFDRVVKCIHLGGRMDQTLCVLHGGGGTGKSRLMKLIAAVLKKHNIGTVSTCPTGIGASHLENGRTFHAAFKTFRENHVNCNDLELLRLTFTEQVKLVVVDEMSMFKAEFLVLLDQRLRAIYQTDTIFGGRSIILAGDFLQLDVTGGTALCKVLYMHTTSDELLSARALFRRFTVFFLRSQHRAAGCPIQQANLAACRALPAFYPMGHEWSRGDAERFCPLTPEVINSVTKELTVNDVANDSTWLDDLTILVTNNVDKAVLTACAARVFARRHGSILFRWRRQTRQTLPPEMQSLVYDENANPLLFGYFVAGAPAHVLDNNSGNVGWGVANGTPCRFHSLAWEDPHKRQVIFDLVRSVRSSPGTVVDLPYPPDYINVELLDSDQRPLSAELWPPENNLECEWLHADDTGSEHKSRVVIPIGAMSKYQSMKLGTGILEKPYDLAYDQHAVELGFVRTVWKAQGSTLKKVLLFLESSQRLPKWKFEHLYVGISRVTSVDNLRCFPLSGGFRKAKLFKLRPSIYTTKWRLDNRDV